MEVWSTTRCVCPEVEFDTKYYMIGQEDRRKKRLIHDDRSVIARSSIHLERKLQRWGVKYERMMLRKSKRKQKARKDAKKSL